jgi:hypothetical protein
VDGDISNLPIGECHLHMRLAIQDARFREQLIQTKETEHHTAFT